MVPVLSKAQIREFDEHMASKCHVPSLLLMENAGSGACAVLVREMLGGAARRKRVVVVSGTGNNGGDGFVVARHLAVHGASAAAVLVGDERRMTSDAGANLAAWRGIGGELHHLPLAMHGNGGALATIAAAHAAAASRNFLGLEYHFIETPWIAQYVRRDLPLFRDGHLILSDAPGLGVELDREVCKKHLESGAALWD